MNQRTEFSTDIKEVKNSDDKDGDDEAVEDTSVRDESRDEADHKPGEEEHHDDGVNDVPHVTVEDPQLLAEPGRFTDKELHSTVTNWVGSQTKNYTRQSQTGSVHRQRTTHDSRKPGRFTDKELCSTVKIDTGMNLQPHPYD